MLDYRDHPELSPEFLARHPMDDPRFEPWLEAWYGSPDDEHEFGSVAYQDEETETLFIVRAWAMGPELTRRFGTESIAKRLWQQVTEIDWYAPFEEGGRIVWDAAFALFENAFEPNAGWSLGHLSEGSGLETAIYMFWDMAAWYAGAESATDRQKNDFLRICERALASPKASLQESALHGLGHATPCLAEAKQAIKRFLAKGEPQRKELRHYAEAALTNRIN